MRVLTTRIHRLLVVSLLAVVPAAQAHANTAVNAQATAACPAIVATRPTIVPPQRYRAGEVVPPYSLDEPLRWLECPAPEYPLSASRTTRRLVFLTVTVSETGAVSDLRPRAQADAEGFFDAAVAAVRRWRATAPKWKTLPVRSSFAADIVFDPNAASAPSASEPAPAATPARVETPPAQTPAPAPVETATAPPATNTSAPPSSTPPVATTPTPASVATPPQPEPKPAPVEKVTTPVTPPAPTSAVTENKPAPAVETPPPASNPTAVTPQPASVAAPAPVSPPPAQPPASTEPARVTTPPASTAAATPPPATPTPATSQPAAAESAPTPTRPCPQFFTLLATSRAPQNYRAGDMVPNHLLDARPEWVQCPPPDFAGVGGRVAMLIVVLDENGSVREVRPRGHRETDVIFRRAKAAVTNWRVNPPPRYKAQPVWTSTAIDIQNDGRVTQASAPVATPAPSAAAPAPSSTATEPVALPAAPSTETAQTPSRAPSNETPFAVEYYYKTKWGFADEFWRLFLKNHWPVLRKQIESGRILEVRAEKPVYHPTEDGRWDYRVTIVFRSTAAAFATVDTAALERELFPNQEVFRREEQRRFELLLAHWDVPVAPVALPK